MNYTLVALAVILMVFLCGSREGFIDFGLSGYVKPITNFKVSEGAPVDVSQYKRDMTVLTRDEIAGIIKVMQESTKKESGQCLQPIQTIYINRYTGPQGDMYDSRVMFFDQVHDFVTELSGQFLKNAGNTFSVLSLNTPKQISKSNGFSGGGISNFLPQETMESAIAPSKGLLGTVV